MLFGNPVQGKIENPPVPGNILFGVTQKFGCTGVTAEPPLGACKHYHRGIDLGNGRGGDPVLAAQSGVVHAAKLIAVAGAPSGYQSLIVLDHGGGWGTFYIHEQTTIVKKGQHVSKGQKMASVGKVGAGSYHLHFAIKKSINWAFNTLSDANGTWLNPLKYLEQFVA